MAIEVPKGFKSLKYRRFFIQFKSKRRIYGGIPNREDLLEAWYETKLEEKAEAEADPNVTSDEAGTVDEVKGELDLETEVSKSANVFRRDKEGIFFQDGLYLAIHQMKAACKQAASLLKITTNKRGSKQTFAEGMTLASAVTIDDKRYLTDDKLFFQQLRDEPDGMETFAGHVSGPQGNRSIIKMHEYIDPGAILEFEVQLLDVRMNDHAASKEVSANDLFNICEHIQFAGVGSNRSFDSGQLVFMKFEEITDKEPTPIWLPPETDSTTVISGRSEAMQEAAG